MLKLFLILSILSMQIFAIGQIDFKKLKESEPIEYTSQMSIFEYSFQGELYTGDAFHKNLLSDVKYHFVNGKKHGLETAYYKNGNQKEESEYDYGVKLYHKKWSKDGTLEYEVFFKKGLKKSRKTYYSSGQLKSEEKYKRKGSLAKQTNYDRSERLESKGKIIIDSTGKREKSNKTGRWKYYDNKGKLRRKEKWKNGELIAKRKK